MRYNYNDGSNKGRRIFGKRQQGSKICQGTGASRTCGHIEIIEVDELSAIRKGVTDPDIRKRVNDFNETFEIREDCSVVEQERAARTSVALDKLVENGETGILHYIR